MKTSTPTKRVSDLTLAALLRSRGHKLLEIHRDGNRSLFVFEATATLEADVLVFYNGEARVEPLTFSELMRSLKAAAMSQASGR